MALVEPYGYCRRCKHLFVSRLNSREVFHACVFILNTGVSRPCPAGKGCIVRRTLKPGEKRDTLRRIINAECDQRQGNGEDV